MLGIEKYLAKILKVEFFQIGIAFKGVQQCSALKRIFAAPSSSKVFTIFPGEPITTELSGITLPSGIKALAPIIQFLPITARFKNDGVHTNQTVIANCTTMQHDFMTNGDIFANI